MSKPVAVAVPAGPGGDRSASCRACDPVQGEHCSGRSVAARAEPGWRAATLGAVGSCMHAHDGSRAGNSPVVTHSAKRQRRSTFWAPDYVGQIQEFVFSRSLLCSGLQPPQPRPSGSCQGHGLAALMKENADDDRTLFRAATGSPFLMSDLQRWCGRPTSGWIDDDGYHNYNQRRPPMSLRATPKAGAGPYFHFPRSSSGRCMASPVVSRSSSGCTEGYHVT